MNLLATIVIPARNAATTIERAIASAVRQGDYPIVLVDDFSDDDTIPRARKIAGRRLEVVRPTRHETLGVTRQTGLMAVKTPYGVWLDADDELLPGRVDRMIAALDGKGADVASDGVELRDGITGSHLKTLPVPAFLKSQQPARLFERMYLPGPGVIGFRTEFAQAIGYDPELHGPEDTDFLLRSIAAGARFQLLEHIGYGLYAYPQSVSRQIENQKRMYRRLLRKHAYAYVRELYASSGLGCRITAWGLASMAIFREEYEVALEFVAEAESLMEHPNEVLERQGPCRLSEGWRVAFQRGTILLLLGRSVDAAASLEYAERLHATPEAANNLGVALRMLGKTTESQTRFERALERRPDFHDARVNAGQADSVRVTTHPLRVVPARSDYSELRR
jgi:glycosyltransferase involved in cell wall biosynthesis